uniref:ARAD1C19096p n=1 Tax=Blastobotrys adeninivorans TaxID=409370 RepID=A0A060T0X1_BLAAD
MATQVEFSRTQARTRTVHKSGDGEYTYANPELFKDPSRFEAGNDTDWDYSQGNPINPYDVFVDMSVRPTNGTGFVVNSFLFLMFNGATKQKAAEATRPPQAAGNGQDKPGNRPQDTDDEYAWMDNVNFDDDFTWFEALDALTDDIRAGKTSDEKAVKRLFDMTARTYERSRLPEVKDHHPGLRLNQYKKLILEEFEKSSQNPYNWPVVAKNGHRR